MVLELHENGVPVSRACRSLDIPLSSFYHWVNREPSRRERENAALLVLIETVAWTNNHLFGIEKMRLFLQGEYGIRIGYKRVHRIMKLNGHLSVFRSRKKRTGKRQMPEVSAANLLSRRFAPKAPNMVWCSDVTEETVEDVTVYLCTVLDLYDRFPVGFAFSLKNDTALALTALNNAAMAACGSVRGLIFHRDRGASFTSRAFEKRLQELGMKSSMSRPGKCIDNGPMEGWQGIIKEMCWILFPDVENWQEYMTAMELTIDYYENHYYQKRYGARSIAQVRKEALKARMPRKYPIRQDPRISRFKRKYRSVR